MKIDIPYVHTDRDRHGNVRVYYRPADKSVKIRLRAQPGTPAFFAELEAARAGAVRKAQALAERPRRTKASPSPSPTVPARAGTLRWLCIAYCSSAEFRRLDPSTANQRRLLLEDICRSPHHRTGQPRGQLEFAAMEERNVERIRDEKIDKPGAANNRVKALRQLFRWAIEKRHTRRNPATAVPYLARTGDGFQTWTPADIQRFEEAHPIGTQARLCLALLLYTGIRRSDLVKLGPQHERGGELHFTETKGSRRVGAKPKVRQIPIIEPLRQALEASRAVQGPFAYLITERGVPFTVNGFGNKMQDWCRAAGLAPGLAAHGLRKAAAVHAAEAGATVPQLMALFGWTTEKEATRYTQAADRRKLAAQAVKLLEFRR